MKDVHLSITVDQLTIRRKWSSISSLFSYKTMGFILDGCLFTYAHIWSKQTFRFVEGIWCHRKSVVKSIFFLRKRLTLQHTCVTCPELPSYISTLYKAFIFRLTNSNIFLDIATLIKSILCYLVPHTKHLLHFPLAYFCLMFFLYIFRIQTSILIR